LVTGVAKSAGFGARSNPREGIHGHRSAKLSVFGRRLRVERWIARAGPIAHDRGDDPREQAGRDRAGAPGLIQRFT
jgi:hypothetical protein